MCLRCVDNSLIALEEPFISFQRKAHSHCLHYQLLKNAHIFFTRQIRFKKFLKIFSCRLMLLEMHKSQINKNKGDESEYKIDVSGNN